MSNWTPKALVDALNNDAAFDVPAAKVSRDGESVVIGYGCSGYIRVTFGAVLLGGAEIPAAIVDGNGRPARQRLEVEKAIRAVTGLYVRN